MNSNDFNNVKTLNYIQFNAKVIGYKDITSKRNNETYTYVELLVNHNGIGKTISYSLKQIEAKRNNLPLILNEVYDFKGIVTSDENGYLKATNLTTIPSTQKEIIK